LSFGEILPRKRRLGKTKKTTSSFGVDYFLPLPLKHRQSKIPKSKIIKSPIFQLFKIIKSYDENTTYAIKTTIQVVYDIVFDIAHAGSSITQPEYYGNSH